MEKKDPAKSVDEALAQVDSKRRGFLKGLLLGSAALAALPLMKSEAVAQDAPQEPEKKKKKKKKGDDGGDEPK
jgi:hypothetical protein